MLRFRLFGIPITVQPWHWLILALIGGGLHIKDRETASYVLMFIAAGFVSILIHELGHALTGRRFGGRPEIVMHGMGGVAIFPAVRFTRGQQILVSVAGPAIQLLCGLLMREVLLRGLIPDVPARLLAVDFAIVSIGWAIINLLPVYPLDGGQILFYSLGPARQTLSLRISMFTAVAVAVGMFATTHELLFPILLGFLAYQNYQMLNHRFR